MKRKTIFIFLKYLIPILVYISSVFWIGSMSYMAFGVLEILLVATLTELSLRAFKKGGIITYILNSLFMLLINAQAVCLFFGRSYLTIVMLSNIESIEDLSGNAFEYIVGVIIVLIISFLPITSLRNIFKLKYQRVLNTILVLDLILAMSIGNNSSPLWGYINVAANAKAISDLSRNSSGNKESASKFYKPGISDSISKPDALVDRPNIILIFVEGLSQSIIDDKRDIMPNVRKYEQSSLFFDNYFNHTFATYRGLEGTLYSGFQLSNYDTNKLVSLQGILKRKGYHTEFINVEPNNRRFSSYLESFGFDSVINHESKNDSFLEALLDKEAYERLFDEAMALSGKNTPFMISIYTFGTHITFDSPDEKFGDGSNAVLNKFYNSDYQFNEFMKKFNESKLADDTMVIFTADHATFVEGEYPEAFPDINRFEVATEQIPFFIYYKGITPQVIDVSGRNSLDLAPTVLDYIDISEPNYFLGDSLFSEKENSFKIDTVFWDSALFLSTDNGDITYLNDNDRSIIQEQLNEYFNAMKYDSSMEFR
ncbi:MAG: LTA synthase family protein [Oscillospiraceae bacterium]|nr:LTA synthase family protein [Oscillospiraceae bacterium]